MKLDNDKQWLTELDIVMRMLPVLLNEGGWDSLIVNRRKPHTYRVHKILETGIRVCLHRFETCTTEEAFEHPHPWPGAFIVLKGKYQMTIGNADDYLCDPEHVMTVVLGAGSQYAITSELAFHSVQPLETCWSVMVNGEPFEASHKKAPTTKGKDLDKMSPEDLEAHLAKFRELVKGYPF